MAEHVEHVDAAHPFLGIRAVPKENGHVEVSITTDETVVIHGPKDKVMTLLRIALDRVQWVSN